MTRSQCSFMRVMQHQELATKLCFFFFSLSQALEISLKSDVSLSPMLHAWQTSSSVHVQQRKEEDVASFIQSPLPGLPTWLLLSNQDAFDSRNGFFQAVKIDQLHWLGFLRVKITHCHWLRLTYDRILRTVTCHPRSHHRQV